MPQRNPLPTSDPRLLEQRLALGGACLLVSVLGWSIVGGGDIGEALTRNTVRLAMAWYAVAVAGMMGLGDSDWRCATAVGRVVRGCWTWGMLSFLAHVGMAFHFYDHWSHAAAFERTRQVSGLGEGLYVSYAFTAFWVADVVAWWLWPSGYARRPLWIHRGLHAFMLVIVFNGMVVFESGFIRYAGLILFAVLAAVWLLALGRRAPTVSDA